MTPGRPSHLGRSTLRQAAKRRDGSSTALVPLIWRHAFRLEQMSLDVLPMSAEAMARALRNLPALYGVDAITIGADGAHLATSCWMAGRPSASVDEAWHAVRSRPLDVLPEPQSVKAAPPIALLVEVTGRLRSVLGEQAGIALVLPDPTSLAASLGVPDATSWASRVLIEIIRSAGSAEPELVLFLGPEARVRPGIAGVCEFFGAQAVHLAASGPGTVVLAPTPSGAEPALPNEPIWLVTTAAEIPDTAEPACLGHTLQELRRTLTG